MPYVHKCLMDLSLVFAVTIFSKFDIVANIFVVAPIFIVINCLKRTLAVASLAGAFSLTILHV